MTEDFERFAKERGYNPRAHHGVLNYFRKLWAGAPRDPDFEAMCLSKDIHFTLLNFAELVVSVSKELELPIDEAVLFISINTGQTQSAEGILTRDVSALTASHSEEDRARKLLSDPGTGLLSIVPVMKPLDRVESLMRFCVAIETWCRKDKPSRFPSLAVADTTVPPHMQKRHPDDIRDYKERRQALGKPWEESTTSAVFKYIAFEFKKAKNRDLAPENITRATTLRSDLRFDDLDVIELLMGLEEHYDDRFQFGDDFNPTTVGSMIDRIDKNLTSRK